MLRFNWKICGGMLLSAALVSVSALQADQKAGKVRISDFGQNVSPVNYQGAVPESPPFAPPQINTPAPSQGSGSRFSIVPPAPAPAPSPAPAPAPTPSPAPFTPAPYAPAPYAPAPYNPGPGSCSTGGCATGGCAAAPQATGGCATGGCSTGACATGNCCSSGGYASGYQQRMNSVLGKSCCGGGGSACGGGSCCGGGGGSCCGSSSGSKCCDWWHGQSQSYLAKNRALSSRLFGGGCNSSSGNLASDLFGWMTPTGCGGQGCPPAGKYSMVYAADPNYFDSRDGSLYAAPGYGTPVTVPLAPNVHHQFNYGWGVPSSRITPISHPSGYSRMW